MTEKEHIVTIDFCYYQLNVLCKRLSKPRSSIEILVDNACVYNETKEVRTECISLVEQIIEHKGAIGYNCQRDIAFLEYLRENE